MKVLVACEESQAVTIAFRNKGHEAYSCDILPCSGGHPEWHIQGDVLQYLNGFYKCKCGNIHEYGTGKYGCCGVSKLYEWDMMIGHPPCTYLSYAGTAHWNKPGRLEKRIDALIFFGKLWNAPIKYICLENPKGCASPTIAKYSQEVQPYYFGNRDFKTTWLWLKNLPPLIHSNCDTLFETNTHTERPEPISVDNTERAKKRYFVDAGSKRSIERSKTFPGIASAMANQWG